MLMPLLFAAAAHSTVAASQGGDTPPARAPDSPRPVWIFLCDRGLDSFAERWAAIAEVAGAYDFRAIERRAARGAVGALFDEHDLPVAAAYLREIQARGARVRVVSRWLNAVSVEAGAAQLAEIERLPFVDRVEPVRRGRPADAVPARDRPLGPSPVTSVYGASENQLAQINIVAMHDAGFTGEGVVIGMLDTGFSRTHDAFNQPAHPIDVVAEWDFLDDDPDAGFDPNDTVIPSPHGDVYQHAHGTLVLGAVAAYLPNQLIGGAYGASFVLAKTEDIADEYPAEEDLYVAGLEFVEQNGADLVSSSLGYIQWYEYEDLDGLTAVTTQAVNLATARGLVCVTAVGNGGRDQDLPSLIAPSDAFDVISCGAVSPTGTTAGFSSNGPTADGRVKPEVLAQGESTATVHHLDNQLLAEADGTSLSTPLVASAVALVIEARPGWTIAQIRAALTQTADYYVANGTYDPEYARGYGIVDALAASQVSFCDGDLDGDGDVDLTDLSVLLGHFGTPLGAHAALGDLDGDGDVDLADLSIQLGAFGGACP